jgi:hypothetical protein
MERLSRSFELVGQSFRLLMMDKELMLLPLASGILLCAVTASFVFGFGLHEGTPIPVDQTEWLFPVFLFYTVTYTVGIFFQAAVIAGASQRMRGGDPTLGSSLGAAFRRMPSILLWGIMAATVGMLLRSAQDGKGVIGRLGIALVGAAWSMATFFIVPSIVVGDMSVSEGLSHSVEVFKKTWGETMAGGVGLGLAATVGWLVLGAGVFALVRVEALVAAIAVGVTGAIFLMLFFATLEGIYVASLYRYATEGDVPPGMDKATLKYAFQRERTW